MRANSYGLAVTHDAEYKRAHFAPFSLLFCDLEADPMWFHNYDYY
ncbi:MAG TPA: hypothetical protein VLQ80_11390 [Candidatus Saccharimonadia bacterium]|nr:hypothetical protein [Candidatus Saccharimonadia bacterium]